ncbi:MAG: lipoate--protein ligase family protein [Halobellus sp.]|uniref:lipoyl protein ligase domain-containing protein n=1 Tax=Halobellus sp. TaxID=1979212 RepID=UPI0035D52128
MSDTAEKGVHERLLDRASAGVPAVAVWRPGRYLRFGYRDTRQSGYEAAKTRAREAGFEPVERRVGGRAVATTATTVLFAVAEPGDAADVRTGIGERYDTAVSSVRQALRNLGVAATRGEPPETYCPGDHSLQCDGKLVGLAQRVTTSGALVSGMLYVEDRDELADVLADVYAELGYDFDPTSVGTVADAGGECRFDRVEAEFRTQLTRTLDAPAAAVEMIRSDTQSG